MSWRELSRKGWLVSPQLEPWRKKILLEMRSRLPRASDGLWLLSSGTQSVGTVKALFLSHESLLLSAETVNRFLQSSARDRWLLPLPEYHVGGLGIYARAFIAGARVFVFGGKWDARRFSAAVVKNKISLTSLVPTQIFDLVAAELSAPECLRAIVVGGGALSTELYLRARALGWPLLPSYGLTECCSQVATAPLVSLRERDFPHFEVLPHVDVELRESRIYLRSRSLCRWVAMGRGDGCVTLEDPLREGWFETSDRGELSAGRLKILGRADDVVKVLGELVSISEVEHQVREFFDSQELCVVPVAHSRMENQLVLFTSVGSSLAEFSRRLEVFNAGVPGPQRIATICWVPDLPRGELGKLRKVELRSLL